MRFHLIRHTSVPFTFLVWQSSVGFRLLSSVCNAWQQSRMHNLQRVHKTSGPILNHLWTEVQEILGQC